MGNMLDFKAIISGNYSSIKKSTKKADAKDKSTQKSGTITVKRSFNASRTLSQLANAKTKSQVGAIERTVRAQMQSMKKQSGSEEAVKQMKKVLQKTNTKIKALTKEEHMEDNRKIAKIADNKKQEVKLAEELNRKRINREGRENADALNAVDVFDKNKTENDTYAYTEQSGEQATSIDIACDSFEVSTGVSGMECGIAIDALL